MTAPEPGAGRRRVETASLVELLDRVLGGGALVSGDVILALGGVELLRLDLRLLLAPVLSPPVLSPPVLSPPVLSPPEAPGAPEPAATAPPREAP